MATPEHELHEQLVAQQSPVDTAYERRSTAKGPGRPAAGTKVNSTVITDAPFHPSPSLDPKNVEAIEGFDEFKGYLAPAHEAFSLATESLKLIDTARQAFAKDMTKNDHARLLIVAGAAEKKQDQVTRAFDQARKNLTAAAEAIESSLNAPLESKSMGVINGEIRSLVRAMNHEERRKFVMEALQEGDMDVLTSVLGTTHKITGLSKEERAHFTRLYRDAADPTAARRLAATRKAVELIEQRAGLFLVGVEQAMKGKWATVQKLRKANSEAERALLMEADKA